MVIYFRDNVYLVKTLKEFQYIDEYGKDQGANVRQKAKDITNLLTDEARLRQERRSRANMRDRMTKGTTTDRDEEDENAARRKPQQPPAPREQASTSRRNKDDDELKRAMEESRKTFEKEAGKSAEYVQLSSGILNISSVITEILISSVPWSSPKRRSVIDSSRWKIPTSALYLMMDCKRT